MKRSLSFADLALIAALAVVYFIAGKLGLLLAFVHVSASAVWVPTGIALAAFLVLGYRVWPGIFLGAFLVNVTTAGTAATSIGIAVGNTLEGLIGAYLVNEFAHGQGAFDRAKDVFKFTLLAGLVSTTVSATLGVTSLSLGGYAEWAYYGSIWWTWWLGDIGGALIVAPVLVLWSRDPSVRWNRGRVVEAILLLLVLILGTLVVFGGLIPTEIKNYPLSFLCIPILVWVAFRFGQRETATATFLHAGIAIWGTLSGFGPFVRETQNESLLLLQAFLGVIAVMGMALAADVSERKRAERQIQASLREKDLLVKEIHHRIKNNLQVISSMLNLQTRSIKDPKAVEMFKESLNRVRSIALIHEKLHRSQDLSRIDFAEHVRDLTAHLLRSYGVRSERIALKISVDDVLLGMDTAIPCGLILNELVSNSLKYAFPVDQKGEINITLHRGNDDQFTLIVADNGIGLPRDLDFRNTETLGLQLVHTLVEQIDGTVELDRSVGTVFKMVFSELGFKQGGQDNGKGTDPDR